MTISTEVSNLAPFGHVVFTLEEGDVSKHGEALAIAVNGFQGDGALMYATAGLADRVLPLGPPGHYSADLYYFARGGAARQRFVASMEFEVK